MVMIHIRPFTISFFVGYFIVSLLSLRDILQCDRGAEKRHSFMPERWFFSFVVSDFWYDLVGVCFVDFGFFALKYNSKEKTRRNV